MNEVAWNICALLAWEYGPQSVESICDSRATIRITGLLGINPKHTKMKFSTGERLPLDVTQSRFITFELDMTGK